jgi:hypothetical protein
MATGGNAQDRAVFFCTMHSLQRKMWVITRTLSALIALHRALYHPASLVLAPALRQSQELYGKVAAFYQRLDNPIPPKSYTQLTLTFENDSRIISLPGDEKNIRGYSGADLLLVDEAARVEDQLYFSVRPCSPSPAAAC